jgi:SAM-dependent methyltransferase
MSKLTEKTHWDGVHSREQRDLQSATESIGLGLRTKEAVKRLLGNDLLDRMTSYGDYLLWDVIFPTYLPPMQGAKVVEVGSAPGEFTAKFGKKFKCVPYGIEYSEVGVEVNRRVFSNDGFDPDNVIHADFFSDEFANRYKGAFDAVLSRGFIEHFDDVASVIERHVNLLKPGGYLIVTIPNLRGFNYGLLWLLDKEAIRRHNLKIMRKSVYQSLFERPDLQRVVCDYLEPFSFYILTAEPRRIKKAALMGLYRLQPALNLMFRTAFGPRDAKSSLFSPCLLYIGKKL